MNQWLPFEWIGAIRFLRDGYLQTAFIVGGIAIGVSVIVFMSAMLAGLEANFVKRVLTAQPQIQLTSLDQIARPLRGPSREIVDATIQRPAQRAISIDQWQSIRDFVISFPEVIAVAPTVAGSALAIRGDASRAISVLGFEPDSYFRIVRIPDYLVAGQATLTSDQIIVGSELAKDLGAALGDKIRIEAANGNTHTLAISGIVDFGNRSANQRNAYVALRTAQSLLGLIGGVTAIDLAIRNVYDAEILAQTIQATVQVRADSWITSNAQFFTAVNAQKSTNTLIRAFVGLSVAFGIAAVLVVSVVQRSKDIGILRAMGTTRGQVLRIFLLQGGVLGFVGSIFGAGMGATALFLWHSTTRQADGSELFPLILETNLFVLTALLAAATGVLAAAAPALRAAKLDPVVAIRG
jgi:lipoprotein-releasing system permease protein